MASSPSSCLNHLQLHPLPTSITRPSPPNTSQPSWGQAERSWRKQYALGMACSIILGVETIGFAINDQTMALALDTQHQQESRLGSKSKAEIERWSDKRSCTPWRLNSLETIVPEDLPRPSARRRWQSVELLRDHASPEQVTVKVPSHSKPCFSL